MSYTHRLKKMLAGDRIYWTGVLVVTCLVVVFIVDSQSAASYPSYVLAIVMLVTFSHWRDVFKLSLVRWIAVLLLWFSASTFWSTPYELRDAASIWIRAVLVFGFVVAVGECQLRGEMQQWMSKALTIFGTLMMAAALINFFLTDPADGRLNGLGQLDTHIIAALVFGVVMLFGLKLALDEQSVAWRFVAGVCIMLAIACIALSDSRTAWVAVSLGVATYLVANRLDDVRQLILGLIVLTLVAAVALAVLMANDSTQALILPRGDSFRFSIWSHFLEQIARAPLLGQGINTNDVVEIGDMVFDHPHNLYLAILFQGGVLGLAIYLIMLSSACRYLARCFQLGDAKLALSILVLAGSAFLLDGHELVDKVGEAWFLVWLPIGIAVGLSWGEVNRPEYWRYE